MNDWKKKVQEDSGIDLWRLVEVFLKRLWLIALVAVIVGAASFLYTKTCVTPLYRTDFSAYVNNRVATEDKDSTNTGDLNASIGLMYLYNEIIASRAVLTDAAKLCGLDYSYGTLSGMVSTQMPEKAALIRVYVTAADPEVAVRLAAAIAEVAPDHVARVVEGSSMQIVDDPVRPTSPFSPSAVRNAVLAALIGAVLAYALFVLLELINDIVQGSDDLESRYDMVVVGKIPDMAQLEKSDRYGYKKYGYGKQ